jgi:UDP-N-acetylmuramoyl-L-alanyl-D-glutamate--2,6-diaminopimelate ligase
MRVLGSASEVARLLHERVSGIAGQLRVDSRQVQPGDAFVAWPGQITDGRRHVGAALEAGALLCVVEAEGAEAFNFDDARIVALAGLKAAAGQIANAWFGAPSERLDVVASTGTNGKTSTAWWTAQALTHLGRRCGVVGTLGIGEPPVVGASAGQVQPTGLTTPDPVALHQAFADFAARGFQACAIEASSIGVVEHRLAGARITVALFTNFTRDHLDYHGSMEAYWAAKRALFDWAGLRAASINVDDEAGARLAAELVARGLPVWTSALAGPARLQARDLRYQDGGLAFEVVEGDSDVDSAPTVRSTLIGDYNASNLLVVIGGLRGLGIPLAAAVAAVPHLSAVPGRMQRVGAVSAAQPAVVVDYAHTPDALEKVLQALRPMAVARGGRLWCVFGCGGNRDASKRPLMGAIADRLADRVVLTSDNPRDEAPAFILAQILAGVVGKEAVEVIEERGDAIRRAVSGADAADVIVVAGKGHEDYQEVAGTRRPFSDVEASLAALRESARGVVA